MASPSGTSSGSSHLQISGSEGNLQAMMDQKKLKRKISNRESARRSRMRKQKHLDDLTALVNQLNKENGQLLRALSLTKQHYVAVEAENSVLRAQAMELSNRLQSLDAILDYLNVSNASGHGLLLHDAPQAMGSSISAWNCMYMNQQPIMASADNMPCYLQMRS